MNDSKGFIACNLPLPNSVVELRRCKLAGYKWQIPSSVVRLSGCDLRGYEFPLPRSVVQLSSCDLIGYEFTLPDSVASLIQCKFGNHKQQRVRKVDVKKVYNHPLPESLKDLILCGFESYRHPIPASIARGVPIPVIPNIHKRVYEAVTTTFTLNMNNWHSCETTHCRAGTIVHLAGEAGYLLERTVGHTGLAALLIYQASDPDNTFCMDMFFESDEEALADMKRLAELD